MFSIFSFNKPLYRPFTQTIKLNRHKQTKQDNLSHIYVDKSMNNSNLYS